MKRFTAIMLVAAFAVVIAGCSNKSVYNARYISSSSKRGNPWDYDAGAPKDSKWPDLFAETPNYRAFGGSVINATRGEKFRWKMGPMWYRGRLGKNEVKVFIIGQEGAQDENVSNRSFTGSTGTRMQKFINYLGIDRSYLFMNTFVYTITGQYSLFGEDRENESKLAAQKQLLWLAQHKDSIVVEHRHKLFDYMLEQNPESVRVVIGVGTAGKDSLATWFKSHGGKCNARSLSRSACKGSGKLEGVIGIGVSHPGAASARNGGSSAASRLITDFRNKAAIVSKAISTDKSFLEADPGMKRNFDKPFAYGYAPVPHRDFPFGTNWNMGRRGTTSNRRGSDTIQVFSAGGCYNNAQRVNGRCVQDSVHRISYKRPTDRLKTKPKEMASIDVPYESPKTKEDRRSYDPGPGAHAQDMLGFYDHDYNALGATPHPSWGPMGIYRGRLDSADILILADQQSHDDVFSGRALTGEGGQKLQKFLNQTGVGSSYAIIRSLPVDTLDLSTAEAKAIALNDAVFDSRMKLINSGMEKAKVILAVGPVAQAIAEQVDFGIPVIKMSAPSSSSYKSSWNKAFTALKKIKFAGKPSSKYVGGYAIIPREDLPAYTRWWMGTSGSRAARAYETIDGKKVYSPNYYKLHAPGWAKKWKAGSMNTAEKASFAKFQRTGL